jgi:hypothetical protein
MDVRTTARADAGAPEPNLRIPDACRPQGAEQLVLRLPGSLIFPEKN